MRHFKKQNSKNFASDKSLENVFRDPAVPLDVPDTTPPSFTIFSSLRLFPLIYFFVFLFSFRSCTLKNFFPSLVFFLMPRVTRLIQLGGL